MGSMKDHRGRLCLCGVAILLAASSCVWAWDYEDLCPRPKWGDRYGVISIAVGDSGDGWPAPNWAIAVPSLTDAYNDMAEDFVDWLAENDVKKPDESDLDIVTLASMSSDEDHDYFVMVGPGDNGYIDTELDNRDLDDDWADLPNSGAEGYVVSVHSGDDVVIGGGDYAGAYYGIQTLKQLVSSFMNVGTYDYAIIQEYDIVDYPDFGWRGYYSYDCSHLGDLTDGDDYDPIKDLVETMGEYKLNVSQISFGNLDPDDIYSAESDLSSHIWDPGDDNYVAIAPTIFECSNAHPLTWDDDGGSNTPFDIGECYKVSSECMQFSSGTAIAHPDEPQIDGPSGGGNWLSNGDFASDTTGWGFDNERETQDTEGEMSYFEWDSANGPDGTSGVLKYTVGDYDLTGNNDYASWMSDDLSSEGCSDGDIFTLRLCYKEADGTAPPFMLKVAQLDAADHYIPDNNFDRQTWTRFTPATTTWKKIFVSTRLKSGCKKLLVYITPMDHEKNYTVHLDMLKLRRMNAALCYAVRTGTGTGESNIVVTDGAETPTTYTEDTDYSITTPAGMTYDYWPEGLDEYTSDHFNNGDHTAWSSDGDANALRSYVITRLGGSIGPGATIYVSYDSGLFSGWPSGRLASRYNPRDPHTWELFDDICEVLYDDDANECDFSCSVVGGCHDEVRMGFVDSRTIDDGTYDTNWKMWGYDLEQCVAKAQAYDDPSNAAVLIDWDDMVNPFHNASWDDYWLAYSSGEVDDGYPVSWLDGSDPGGCLKKLKDDGYNDDIMWAIWWSGPNGNDEDSPYDDPTKTCAKMRRSPAYFNHADVQAHWLGAPMRCSQADPGYNARQNTAEWSWLVADDSAGGGDGLFGFYWAGTTLMEDYLKEVADYAWTAELVPNPGFELGTLGLTAESEGTSPTHWTLGSDWSWDKDGGHTVSFDGLANAAVCLSKAAFTGTTGYLDSDSITVKGGQAYDFSFYSKICSISPGTLFVLVMEYDDTTWKATHAISETSIHDWDLIDVNDDSDCQFTTDADTDNVVIRAHAVMGSSGSVTLYLDNLTLRPWEQD